MRRLAAHPAVADALALADISGSWAQRICEWTGLLPEDQGHDADAILPGAAAGGTELCDLAGLAEEIRRQTAGPDADGDDGFEPVPACCYVRDSAAYYPTMISHRVIGHSQAPGLLSWPQGFPAENRKGSGPAICP